MQRGVAVSTHESSHHVEQCKPNYCVPACACMILSRLGRPQDQQTLAERLSSTKQGFAFEHAAPRIDGIYECRDPNHPMLPDYLRAKLSEPRWISVYMFSRVLGEITEGRDPAPVSRFGPLSHSFGRHAIVLIRGTSDGFQYLDPYYPAPGQPFTLKDEEFARAFQGLIMLSPRLP